MKISVFRSAYRWITKMPSVYYEYGTCGPHQVPARRHPKTGAVEFVIWSAGEQGYVEDYWVQLHPYWWSTFNPA